jgi:hypothetical protein
MKKGKRQMAKGESYFLNSPPWRGQGWVKTINAKGKRKRI